MGAIAKVVKRIKIVDFSMISPPPHSSMLILKRGSSRRSCRMFSNVGVSVEIVQIPIRNSSFWMKTAIYVAKIDKNERVNRKFYRAHVVPTPKRINP